MTNYTYADNVSTTLAAASASASTTFVLGSATNLPTLPAGFIMPLTLNDAATRLIYEIVYVTAIAGTTLTVLRGQEGTAAQNWNIGDFAFSAVTAGGLNGLQSIQTITNTIWPDTGTTNAIAITLVPAPTSLAALTGITLKVKVANTITGAFTINPNGFGATTVVDQSGNAFTSVTGANAALANDVATFIFNGTSFVYHPTTGRLLRSSLYTLVSGTLMVSINGAAPVTAASTYTQTPGTNKVRVRGIGGGGGGSGSVITAANGTSIGAPGTSGAPGAGIFFAGFGDAEITVGVGAPGGIGSNGSNGSTSSLGTLISWPGGIGGGSSSAATIPLSGGNGGVVVATGANLTPNATSDNGTPSISINDSCAFGGAGGRTPDGGGPPGTTVNANANNATTLGAGGAGTANFNNGDGASTGGNGASGFVLVEDYA